MEEHDEIDFAELLSIAVDSEGKTDQVFRWAGENWHGVWERETAPLVSMVNAGEFAAIVFPRGDYYCDIEILKEQPELIECSVLDQWVLVPSGTLVVADLGKLAEDWEVSAPVEYDSFAQMEVSVPPGWYKVSFIFPRNISIVGEGRRRIFGAPSHPACIVRCTPSSQHHSALTALPVFSASPTSVS